ncbi:MAG TPA: hypothetical protein VGJ33_12610 [Candidatus Angelobacter sp.]|jgi:hypothetical protein
MPSSSHQSLLLWIARKMTTDGFLVTACDGSIPQGGHWNALPQPPEFAGVRPDLCGIAPTTGKFAFGEAKTLQDIDTPHTQKQLRVFGSLIHRDGRTACRLYVAVPRSAAGVLDRVLGQVGLLGACHVVRLHIPDCFVTEHRDERL